MERYGMVRTGLRAPLPRRAQVEPWESTAEVPHRRPGNFRPSWSKVPDQSAAAGRAVRPGINYWLMLELPRGTNSCSSSLCIARGASRRLGTAQSHTPIHPPITACKAPQTAAAAPNSPSPYQQQ